MSLNKDVYFHRFLAPGCFKNVPLAHKRPVMALWCLQTAGSGGEAFKNSGNNPMLHTELTTSLFLPKLTSYLIKKSSFNSKLSVELDLLFSFYNIKNESMSNKKRCQIWAHSRLHGESIFIPLSVLFPVTAGSDKRVVRGLRRIRRQLDKHGN